MVNIALDSVVFEKKPKTTNITNHEIISHGQRTGSRMSYICMKSPCRTFYWSLRFFLENCVLYIPVSGNIQTNKRTNRQTEGRKALLALRAAGA